MITVIIRILLSVTLLYFVYAETGWATTLALFLLFVNSELMAIISKLKSLRPNVKVRGGALLRRPF